MHRYYLIIYLKTNFNNLNIVVVVEKVKGLKHLHETFLQLKYLQLEMKLRIVQARKLKVYQRFLNLSFNIYF